MSVGVKTRWKLLGEAELRVGEAILEALPKKTFLVAARLIVSTPDGYATRDDIAAFLWPRAADEQRRASLRTLIKRIRLAFAGLDQPPLLIDETALRLAPDSVSDLAELKRHLARGELADVVEASRLYDGPLLAGTEPAGDWIEAERKRLADTFAKVATRALKDGALLAQPRLREAIELKILAARPINLEAQQALAKLQSARGHSRARRSASPAADLGATLANFSRRDPTADNGPLPV